MAANTDAPADQESCYAVIFSSQRTTSDADGYGDMAETMVRLASEQAGFLGIESARSADGFGITVSYWNSWEAIAIWRAHAEHVVAQRLGRERWYASYDLRIAKVERHIRFPKV